MNTTETKLLQLAQQIADQLEGFSLSNGYSDCDWYKVLENKESRVRLGLQLYKDKLTVEVGTPATKPARSFYELRVLGSRDPVPSIGISAKKTPEQIAKDINRRLMSKAICMTNQFFLKLEEREKEENKFQATVKRALEAIGSKNYLKAFEEGRRQVENDRRYSFYSKYDLLSIEIEPYCKAECTLRLEADRLVEALQCLEKNGFLTVTN